MVSKRLASFGFKPIVGDLVYAPGSEGTEYLDVEDMDAPELGGDEAANGADAGETDSGNKRRAQRNLREVIEITEDTVNNYTIDDVLLPTPGYDIKYPANQVADWYAELLKADGLSFDNFKLSVRY